MQQTKIVPSFMTYVRAFHISLELMQNEQKHTSDTLIIYKQNLIINDNIKKTILKEGK
jgi:hypothetical protein